jgi:polysaccharide export outer membrane protein
MKRHSLEKRTQNERPVRHAAPGSPNVHFYLPALLLGLAQLASSQQPAAPLTLPNYILGPGDQIALVVPALAADFTGKTFRIEGGGDIALPVVGTVHAGGRTVHAVQDDLKDRLSAILQTPDVVVSVAEFAGQPVSVLGSVTLPGIRQLQGHKTLFEVLSLSGGLRPEAGTTVEITRDLRMGPIPLPNATASSTGEFSIATIKLKNVMNASAENILVLPGDTVFVPKAGIVYAVGSVTKPGGYTIGEDGLLSALQMVSLAGGFLRTAATAKSKILRLVPGTAASRTEIDINIKRLMAGKIADVPLQPNDILFIPNSGAKSAGFRTIDAIVTAATGLAIYSGSRL